ncbi:MAG: DUF3520 domain-containing protein [Planctomycetes bacterium]|nr:DUF3520 domain-containing protein [Planctomycetota bacterium]
MNRQEAEKLLAVLIFGDLDETSKIELTAYLQTDDELRERLADMRMAIKITSDALQNGPDPVLGKRRLKRLARLAKQKKRPPVFTLRYMATAAAVLFAIMLPLAIFMPSLQKAKVSYASLKSVRGEMPALDSDRGISSIYDSVEFASSESPASQLSIAKVTDHSSVVWAEGSKLDVDFTGGNGLALNDTRNLNAEGLKRDEYLGYAAGRFGEGKLGHGVDAYGRTAEESMEGEKLYALAGGQGQGKGIPLGKAEAFQDPQTVVNSEINEIESRTLKKAYAKSIPYSSEISYPGASDILIPKNWAQITNSTISGEKAGVVFNGSVDGVPTKQIQIAASTGDAGVWIDHISVGSDTISVGGPTGGMGGMGAMGGGRGERGGYMGGGGNGGYGGGGGRGGGYGGGGVVGGRGGRGGPGSPSWVYNSNGSGPTVTNNTFFEDGAGIDVSEPGIVNNKPIADFEDGRSSTKDAGKYTVDEILLSPAELPPPRPAGTSVRISKPQNSISTKTAPKRSLPGPAYRGTPVSISKRPSTKKPTIARMIAPEPASKPAPAKDGWYRNEASQASNTRPLLEARFLNSRSEVSDREALLETVKKMLDEKNGKKYKGDRVTLHEEAADVKSWISLTKNRKKDSHRSRRNINGDRKTLYETDAGEISGFSITGKPETAQEIAGNKKEFNKSMTDGHVDFAKRPSTGTRYDNIYNERAKNKFGSAMKHDVMAKAIVSAVDGDEITIRLNKEAESITTGSFSTSGAAYFIAGEKKPAPDAAYFITREDKSGPGKGRKVPIMGDLPMIGSLLKGVDEKGLKDLKKRKDEKATEATEAPKDITWSGKPVDLSALGVEVGRDGKYGNGLIGLEDGEEKNNRLSEFGFNLPADEFDMPLASHFKSVPVNPWVMTGRDQLSTFALDVDTASYTLSRRYIYSGFLPPAGAVRMEEFINYFNYQYPQRSDRTFSIHAEAAPSPFAAKGKKLTLLKVGVKARTIGRDQQKPAHLVLVVDASASMGKPDRLGLVKQALNLLINKLSTADRVTLITCSDKSRLHLESVSLQHRDKIHQAINAIQASGSTNLLAGLQLGYATARRSFASKQINHVVLCSDGVANVGQTEADLILKAVDADRKQGITITCVGVGLGTYNDAFLETLANRGDGSYVYLDSTRQGQRVFVEQLSATLHTVAKDARIQVNFNPDRVRRYRLIGYENRDIEDKRFRDDTVDAGEVGSGQCSTALYELELTGQRCTDQEGGLGTVFVRYRNADTGKMEEISSRLRNSIVRRRKVAGSPRFFLAATASRFAEILRQSEHATNASLKDVLAVAEKVSLALPLDRDVRELTELIRRSEHLPRPK